MDAILRASRRDFLAGLAAAGSGALISRRPLAAQIARPRLINVHHHLTAPAYVKFLTNNKVREFPIKSAAEGIEDMDKAGVTIALCSTIGPGIWFGNLADTRRLRVFVGREWRNLPPMAIWRYRLAGGGRFAGNGSLRA